MYKRSKGEREGGGVWDFVGTSSTDLTTMNDVMPGRPHHVIYFQLQVQYLVQFVPQQATSTSIASLCFFNSS